MAIPKICEIPECDKVAYARGWCNMHYARWLKHGSPHVSWGRGDRPPGLSKPQILAYELDRASRDGECVIARKPWKACGHKSIKVKGRHVLLHRLSLEVRLGRELQAWEQVNHACNRAACINADHLYVGTQAENIKDRELAGRTARIVGEERWTSKLSNANVLDIRRRHKASGISCEELAKEYGVTRGCVRQILIGKTWKHLLPDELSET